MHGHAHTHRRQSVSRAQPFVNGIVQFDDWLHLFVQLQLYAEKGAPNVVLRESYTAKAYNKEALDALLDKDGHRITVLVSLSVFFLIVFSLVIFVFMFFYIFMEQISQ